MTHSSFVLHEAAQQATRCGMHDLASLLLFEAADQALTPGGKRVLEEQAIDEAVQAELSRVQGFRVH